MQKLLTTKEAAKVLGHSPATLRDWRCSHKGPAFVRFGPRNVKYPEDDLQTYVAERRFVPFVTHNEVKRNVTLQKTA